ncbi:MAG: acyl-CoA dehydrogenase [Candidatus Latescibacteria bacterium]|nr:acyl-CoA dehydrogenase [bacterium]MBD3423590.1 acyl-CoA dehydrogenase [Candidatus Latescibacterota bacterium]
MNYQLSEEERMLRKTAADFANRSLAAVAEESNREGIFQDQIYRELGELGFMGMTVPEEYGGVDFGNFCLALAIEEISRVCASTAVAISVHNSLVNWAIMKFGSSQMKENYLPRLASGELLGAYALTEPGAGSDVSAISTSAVLEGDTYKLNGTKNFISTGDKAGVIIVFARTDSEDRKGGLSAFVVEPDSPGFSIGKKEDKMGLSASTTVELVFEDCEIPAANILGSEGQGMSIALGGLEGGRIGIAAQSLGIAQAAMDEAVKYGRERQQFGRRILDFQGNQFKIAEMATRLEAARLLVYQAARLRDRGEPCARESSMAKLYASEAANYLAYQALQIHGGVGYTSEFLIERLYRDARVLEIYEGASEIQKIVIFREVMKEYDRIMPD